MANSADAIDVRGPRDPTSAADRAHGTAGGPIEVQKTPATQGRALIPNLTGLALRRAPTGRAPPLRA